MKESVHYEVRTNSGRVVCEATTEKVAIGIKEVRMGIDPRNELNVFKITKKEEKIA